MKTTNVVVLVGRLGGDPRLSTTPQTQLRVAELSLATHRPAKDKDGNFVEETDWHTVVCFGYTAERCEGLSRGDMVEIVGNVTYRTYQDDMSRTVKVTEIRAFRAGLFEKFQKDAQGETSSGHPPGGGGSHLPPADGGGGGQSSGSSGPDDDIPF